MSDTPLPPLPKFDWQILVTKGHTVAARARRLSFGLVIASVIGLICTYYIAGSMSLTVPVAASNAPAWTQKYVIDREHFYHLGHNEMAFPIGFGFLEDMADNSTDRVASADLKAAVLPFANEILQHGKDVGNWKLTDGLKFQPQITSVAKWPDHTDKLGRGVVVLGDRQSYILAMTDHGLEAIIITPASERTQASCGSVFTYFTFCQPVRPTGNELDELKVSK